MSEWQLVDMSGCGKANPGCVYRWRPDGFFPQLQELDLEVPQLGWETVRNIEMLLYLERLVDYTGA